MAIRFFDMFAGIGGFRSGLEVIGGFECVGHCEIDKYANQAYNAIYAAIDVYERIYVPEFLQDECHAGDTPVCFEEFYDNEWRDEDCRSYYEKRLSEINAEEQEEGGITQ